MSTEHAAILEELFEAKLRIESLEADREKAVALVIEAGIATGHADTSADLMAEVLHKVGELRAENAALREKVAKLTAAIDYVTEETGYYTPPSEDAK